MHHPAVTEELLVRQVERFGLVRVRGDVRGDHVAELFHEHLRLEGLPVLLLGKPLAPELLHVPVIPLRRALFLYPAVYLTRLNGCPELSGLLLHECLLYTSDAADDLLCVDLG